MSDFDAAPHLQRLTRLRARLARPHPAEIAKLRDREIARHIDVAQVEPVLVRARGAVANQSDGVVSEDTRERLGRLDRALDRAEDCQASRPARARSLPAVAARQSGESQRAEFGFFKFIAAAQNH